MTLNTAVFAPTAAASVINVIKVNIGARSSLRNTLLNSFLNSTAHLWLDVSLGPTPHAGDAVIAKYVDQRPGVPQISNRTRRFVPQEPRQLIPGSDPPSEPTVILTQVGRVELVEAPLGGVVINFAELGFPVDAKPSTEATSNRQSSF